MGTLLTLFVGMMIGWVIIPQPLWVPYAVYLWAKRLQQLIIAKFTKVAK